MQSEVVGSMMLYSPKGVRMPGFDRVVFAKQAAEKLASVGDICDKGMVCIFDSKCLRTYYEKDVQIKGDPFTEDQRDPYSRLYPASEERRHSRALERDFNA